MPALKLVLVFATKQDKTLVTGRSNICMPGTGGLHSNKIHAMLSEMLEFM